MLYNFKCLLVKFCRQLIVINIPDNVQNISISFLIAFLSPGLRPANHGQLGMDMTVNHGQLGMDMTVNHGQLGMNN